MPVYEYYCESCNGIFEHLRSIREASEPWPCPVCDREGRRVMPTSFTAFTFRDGYPRRIPDKGTFWHLGHEVSKPVTGAVRANEHPEINKPLPPPVKSKGQKADEAERNRLIAEHKANVERERQAAIEAHDRKEATKPTISVPTSGGTSGT